MSISLGVAFGPSYQERRRIRPSALDEAGLSQITVQACNSGPDGSAPICVSEAVTQQATGPLGSEKPEHGTRSSVGFGDVGLIDPDDPVLGIHVGPDLCLGSQAQPRSPWLASRVNQGTLGRHSGSNGYAVALCIPVPVENGCGRANTRNFGGSSSLKR